VSKVLIIQRYIPDYRVALFDALSGLLRARGGSLLVAHGLPGRGQRERGDASGRQAWGASVREVTVPLPGGLTPTWKFVGTLARQADVIVAELATTSLNSWALLATHRSKTLVWGHGKSYVSAPNRAEAALESLMARRAAHVLTYTEGGRTYLTSRGVPSSRITAVGNSTDTVELRRLFDETSTDRPQWAARAGSDGPIGLFVGGLDEDKRVRLLLEAGAAAAEIDPAFRLIVAGAGRDSNLVEAKAHEPWLVRLPRASRRELAALAHIAAAVWMPGRVGLIAVDALALGLPILTTAFPFHAPEIEYLTEGRTKFTLPADPEGFARGALSIMRERPHEPQINVPTVQNVASRMIEAINAVQGR
jgi:glycosyltransferase involved in cell wall biosynthesis